MVPKQIMTDRSKCHSLELLDKESGDTVQCTVYSVQCTVYSVQCTVPFKETALEVLRSRNRKKNSTIIIVSYKICINLCGTLFREFK